MVPVLGLFGLLTLNFNLVTFTFPAMYARWLRTPVFVTHTVAFNLPVTLTFELSKFPYNSPFT